MGGREGEKEGEKEREKRNGGHREWRGGKRKRKLEETLKLPPSLR